MATIHRDFDPYHKWFGIPPHEQPPDHYRLLRLHPFESDPEVIENAYNREMADLKAEEHGGHVELVDRLSRELVAARVCLLDAVKKAEYDASLQKRLDNEKEGDDLAEELDRRTEIDRAVRRAKTGLVAERDRLRALANEMSVRADNAQLLVQQLQQQWATVSGKTNNLIPSFGYSQFSVRQTRAWVVPVVIAGVATAVVLVVGLIVLVAAMDVHSANDAVSESVATANDHSKDDEANGLTAIDDQAIIHEVTEPTRTGMASQAEPRVPLKGVLEIPAGLELADLSSELQQLQAEFEQDRFSHPNRILRLSRISDAPEHINLFRQSVQSNDVAVRYYSALALLNHREDVDGMIQVVTECLSEDSTRRQENSTVYTSQMSEVDAIRMFSAYGAELKPAWMQLLNQGDAFAKEFAVKRLADLGSEAKDVVPNLRKLAEDGSKAIEFRRSVAAAIKAIDPSANILILVPVTGNPEVDGMIHRAVKYLAKAPGHRELGGDCLIALALYMAGQDVSHPQIQRAFARCRKDFADGSAFKKWTHNYDHAITTIFLCNVKPVEGRGLIERLVAELLRRQLASGGWTYPTQSRGDTSQTQWCVLALWCAGKLGCNVPKQSMQRAHEWLIRTQDPSGAWGYMGNDPGNYNRVRQVDTRLSLSAAALGSLMVSGDFLGLDLAGGARGRVTTPSAGAAVRAIADGESWLLRHYKINPPQWEFYYMNALARFICFRNAATDDVDRLPSYYRDGVQFMMRGQQRDGSWVTRNHAEPAIETAFATLFLTKSTRKMIERFSPRSPASKPGPSKTPSVAEKTKPISRTTAPPEAITLQTQDGVNLRCTYCPGSEGKDTVPVILIHGWFGERSEYRELALSLQKQGHAVILPDLRGHGESRKSVNGDSINVQKVDPDIAVKFDLETVRQFLLERHSAGELNIKLLCVVGAEGGSLIALNWALQYGVRRRDARAVLMLTPVRNLKGMTWQPATTNLNFQTEVSMLVVTGERDAAGIRDTVGIQRALKNTTMVSIRLPTSVRGTKLLDPKLQLGSFQKINAFIEKHVVSKRSAYPWTN